MTKKQKRHIIATAGTIVFLALVFLILWYVYLSAPVSEQEEGIELAFSEEEMFGSGNTFEEVNPAPAEAGDPGVSSEPASSTAEPAPAEEQITSDEKTLAAAEKAKKEKEQQEAADRARKEKEDEAKKKADLMAAALNAAGNGSSVSGTGDGGGGNSNNPVHGPGGNGRDHRISGLGGRAPRDGKLPEPSCEFDHYGVVVVQIKIDKDGNNIYAVNATGTNTSDKEMIQCAINAIKKTKWTAGDGEAVGTITYTFNVK